MCGIAGFVSLDGPRQRDRLQALGRTMALAMAHRGRSSSGVWVSPDGQTTLVCARLAVQDVSAAGDQPMLSPDGRTALVSNGEVYASRAPLPAPWPRRSSGDTEFALQQLTAGGDDVGRVLRNLDGMFALAWHDTRSGRTLLARDHFGVKPLVYAYAAGGLLFASEPQTLLATGLVTPEVDPTEFVLRSWIRMDAADERTWYAGIRALQPAEYLVVDGPQTRVRRYWEPRAGEEPVGAEEIRAAFDRAVALRRVADVPRAAVLSGGVDSSAVFAGLRAHQVEVRPYVVQYEEGAGGSSEDVRYARMVADAQGAELTVCELSRTDAVELVPEVAARLARPLLHGSELAMYQLYRRIAADGRVVVYSGHGADELWGYQDGGYFPIVDPLAGADKHGQDYLTRRLYPEERPVWARLVEHLARELGVDMDLVREQVWERVLREYRALDTLEPVKRGRHHLLRRFLVYVNHMVDATSAAFTLEDRPTFQDVTLAELAFRCPEHLKSDGRPGSHKELLKQALGSLLPPEVVTRRKQGFPSPSSDAYRTALTRLTAQQGMPFGLPAPPEPLRARLGASELMFLASGAAWLNAAGAQPLRAGDRLGELLLTEGTR
jgi:asparagine synthase (glutamine-hydrolysing)